MHLFNPEQALALACDEAIKRRRSASRRECIATAALQGMLADPSFTPKTERLVELSVTVADALIAELDKGQPSREQAACARVLAAVRAYLPPDGIGKDEFIGRVIEAVDGPEFNAGAGLESPL